MENKDLLFINSEFKLIDKDDTKRRFKGLASTIDLDRGGDIVLPEAFKTTLETFKKNPIILFNHDKDKPIGIAERLEIQPGRGLAVEGLISQAKDVEDTWVKMKEGILRGMSFSYRIQDSEFKDNAQVIKELDLFEISVVSIPMNANALLTIAKSIDATQAFRENFAGDIFKQLPDGSFYKFITNKENKTDITKEDLQKFIEQEKENEKTTKDQMEVLNRLSAIVTQLGRFVDLIR
jgi:HK97 family phage prohead protease